jgi:hypothetical protein
VSSNHPGQNNLDPEIPQPPTRAVQVEDRRVEAGFFLDCGRLARVVARRPGIRSEGRNVSLESSALGLRGAELQAPEVLRFALRATFGPRFSG